MLKPKTLGALLSVFVVLVWSSSAQAQAYTTLGYNSVSKYKQVVKDACPKQWEDLDGYEDNFSHRLIYTQQMHDDRVDIWAGDVADKVRYIKFALVHLRDQNGDLIESYSDTASVIYYCDKLRETYYQMLQDKHHSDTGAFEITKLRDTDDDQVLDFGDTCDFESIPPNPTPNGEVADGVGMYLGCSASQRDTDQDGVSDALDMCAATPVNEVSDGVGVWLGCSISQRDTDGDGVNDALDQCAESTDPASANSEGCDKFQIDSDDDGIPDFQDEYPYQNATQCVDY